MRNAELEVCKASETLEKIREDLEPLEEKMRRTRAAIENIHSITMILGEKTLVMGR